MLSWKYLSRDDARNLLLRPRPPLLPLSIPLPVPVPPTSRIPSPSPTAVPSALNLVGGVTASSSSTPPPLPSLLSLALAPAPAPSFLLTPAPSLLLTPAPAPSLLLTLPPALLSNGTPSPRYLVGGLASSATAMRTFAPGAVQVGTESSEKREAVARTTRMARRSHRRERGGSIVVGVVGGWRSGVSVDGRRGRDWWVGVVVRERERERGRGRSVGKRMGGFGARWFGWFGQDGRDGRNGYGWVSCTGWVVQDEGTFVEDKTRRDEMEREYILPSEAGAQQSQTLTQTQTQTSVACAHPRDIYLHSPALSDPYLPTYPHKRNTSAPPAEELAHVFPPVPSSFFPSIHLPILRHRHPPSSPRPQKAPRAYLSPTQLATQLAHWSHPSVPAARPPSSTKAFERFTRGGEGRVSIGLEAPESGPEKAGGRG